MAATVEKSKVLQFTTNSEIDRVFDTHYKQKKQLVRTTAKERIAKINALLAYLQKEENSVRLKEALHNDFRKPHAESQVTEILPTFAQAKEITKNLRVWMQSGTLRIPLMYTGLSAKMAYEPKGTSLIIAPWNYPFYLAIYPLLYAIAAGCTVILKPSEMTPHTAKFIEEMVSASLSENEVKVLHGGIPETTHLLKKRWGHIFFTGSPAVGKIVMRAASANLSSVSLELGGKSPCIVDETANIKASAQRLVWGKFLNSGQTCIAPDYIMVHESKKEELIAALKKEITSFYGDNAEESDSYARIITEKHTERISSYIGDAVQNGAKVAHGGKFNVSDKFIEPTILTGVTQDMQVMKDEIFGPVLPILSYKSNQEVLDVIYSLDKPLSMYLCSTSKKNQRFFSENTSSGGLVINEFILGAGIPSVPFGGVNNSGIGKAFGFHGFVEFSNEKPIVRRNFGTIKFIYPPYTETTTKIISWLKKLV